MNWGRAKNLCLIFLVLLNIFLFVMINVSAHRYKLDNDSRKTILNLLEQNNIKCNKIIESFKPKQKLVLSKFDFDKNKIAKIFFGKNFTFDKNIVKTPGKVLEFTDNGFELDISEKYYEKLDLLVKKIKEPQANFILDTKINNDSTQTFIYRQKYHSFMIENNFIKFELERGYIKKITYEYKQVENFFGPSYEIVSPDIILFKFIKSDEVVKKNEVVIDKFDFIYRTTSENFGLSFSVPCYRLIYNNDSEIVFDAYLGEISND